MDDKKVHNYLKQSIFPWLEWGVRCIEFKRQLKIENERVLLFERSKVKQYAKDSIFPELLGSVKKKQSLLLLKKEHQRKFHVVTNELYDIVYHDKKWIKSKESEVKQKVVRDIRRRFDAAFTIPKDFPLKNGNPNVYYYDFLKQIDDHLILECLGDRSDSHMDTAMGFVQLGLRLGNNVDNKPFGSSVRFQLANYIPENVLKQYFPENPIDGEQLKESINQTTTYLSNIELKPSGAFDGNEIIKIKNQLIQHLSEKARKIKTNQQLASLCYRTGAEIINSKIIKHLDLLDPSVDHYDIYASAASLYLWSALKSDEAIDRVFLLESAEALASAAHRIDQAIDIYPRHVHASGQLKKIKKILKVSKEELGRLYPDEENQAFTMDSEKTKTRPASSGVYMMSGWNKIQ